MLGFLSYLPTVYGIPHLFYGFTVIYLLINKREFILRINRTLLLLILLVMLSFVVRIIKVDSVFDNGNEPFPWFIGILLCYLLATNLKINDVRVLVVCIAVESLAIIIESLLGIKTFLGDGSVAYYNTGLLYYSAPNGLSENSSVAAIKILVAFLLMHKTGFKNPIRIFLNIIFLAALVLTFNRSAIIAFGIFFIFNIIDSWKKSDHLIKAALIGGAFIGVLIFYYGYGSIANQLLRGRSNLSLSGREDIWASAIPHIKSNLLLGNGTFRYYSYAYAGIREHLHNSFLELLATSGLLVFLIYISVIFVNMTKENMKYIIPIAAYSTMQYGIFWGISLLDICLFYFLFNHDDIIAPERHEL